MNIDSEKPKLIYIGDPMCSWCYGISEELSQTVNYYGDKVELEIVMGGLRAGGGEEWNQSFREFLRHHWEDVGMKSGLPFSFALLDLPEFDYDTEPACRAVVTIETMNPEKMLPFFKAVQKGFYLKSKDSKDVRFYKEICNSLDIDFATFSSNFESTQMKENTLRHFQRSGQLGVRSFPTLMLEYKGQRHKIAIGYSTFEEMKGRIEDVIN